MPKKPRNVAYDDFFWVDDLMSGSAGYVSSEKLADPPVLFVPDGHGGYREHQIVPKPKGRMGF